MCRTYENLRDMKNLILKSGTLFAILFVGMMFYAGEAWGADVTISVTFNATYKPQNGVSLIYGDETYGTVSCNSASSNRAIIRNTSSLTISATKEGWTLKSVGLTWRGSNDPANTSVLTITGGTFNSLTSITPSSSKVVIGSESTNNNYQISAITVVFTEGSTCTATQPGAISKGTVSGGVITLTADGDPATGETWYWQDAADGTATSVSGKTRKVSAPGTYYIRSYKASETCWSAASSVVVAAEDFYEPSETPNISVQPVGASYDAGETVTPLSVTATGSGTLSYQWQKNGVDISGATSSTYTPNASGSYTCVVSNTEAGHSATSVTSDAAVVNIESNTYILQGISGTDGTGTLTCDFYTGATTMVTVPATSYDGVSYTKGVQLGGKIDSWDSNMSYHDRMVRYDCKTTHTEFTIVVYNKNSSAKKIYVGDIKENPIGTANTVSSLSSYSVSATSSLTQTYTIDNDKLTPASLYITVESTDVRIVQVIANETGTPLPTPGSVGYTLNFNKPRIGVRAGEKAWLDDTDFEYAPSSNAAAGNSTSFQIKTRGTNYIQFRTDQPSAVKIGVQKNPIFYVADNKAGTLHPIMIPKKSTDGDTIYTVILDAGMHYIVPNGSNVYVTSLEISKTVKITFNGNGAAGTMKPQVVEPGTVKLDESTFIRIGYQLAGWSLYPDGSGPLTPNGGEFTVDSSVDEITLYAVWLDACDAVPQMETILSVIPIRDDQYVDMAVANVVCDYDTTDVHYSIASVSPEIRDLTFKYYYSQIHVEGIPAVNNASQQTQTVTITLQNDCDPASTYTITQTFRIIPKNQNAQIAFIVTGDKGGSFDAYNSSDATASNDLITYLRQFYTVDIINGYATKDEAEIANFYANYDLLIVTDYLSTPEGYTNAIGSLVDKKPILNFEAYVAKGGDRGANWHITSEPKDPNPKQAKMKVLCAGHTVFPQAILQPDTTVNVLSSIGGKGLQGFEIYEAPDFQFLATVENGSSNPLIVCCERQEVFAARLIMYCINYDDMNRLSDDGKEAMHQMVEYLLMTDETRVADCSLVFDNGADNNSYNEATYHAAGGTGTKGDGLWSTAANWAPGYNIIPTPFHGARIIAECHVDKSDAHAGTIKVNKGRNNHGDPLQGKLIIEPQGGLSVAGKVTKVFDTRVASPMTIRAEDLLIKADANNNGAFVYGNKESDVNATVQYYSKASNAKTASPVWQYIGIPFQASKTAIAMYHEAWMCRWAEGSTDNLGGLWQWVKNEDVLLPFEGYCISQEAKKTYINSGKLNPPVTKTIVLDNRDNEGFAFAANSWTAPIKIQEMQDADFTNAEKAIYIYHSGTYDSWDTNKETIINTKDVAATPVPGQYAVIPIHSSPYIGVDSVIPAMQGFFVKTTAADATLDLVYNRVVYDAKYFKTSTQPMRAPRRVAADNAPEVMVLTVRGNEFGGDRVHILSRGDFSDNYEDGWDGRKIEGDTVAPKLAVVKEGGEMAVAAIPTAEERFLSFRAGDDKQYTFTFNYEGETIYLYDRVMEQATEIKTGNTYSFTADNKIAAQRFLITKNPPAGVATSTENAEAGDTRPEKIIHEGNLLILYRGEVYDAHGARVTLK